MNLLQALVRKGVLNERDLPAIQQSQRTSRKSLHLVIIEQGFAKEEDVLPVLADVLAMQLVDLTKVTVQSETLRSMPTKLVHRRGLLPLSRENGALVVATGDPFDLYALDELQTLTGLQ